MLSIFTNILYHNNNINKCIYLNKCCRMNNAYIQCIKVFTIDLCQLLFFILCKKMLLEDNKCMMPSRRVKDMDLAISLATQIGALFIMIGVGYVLIKTDICTISESKLLSQIVLYVSAPCAIINSFQIDLTEEKLKGFLLSIGAAILVHIIYYILAKILTKKCHFNAIESMSIMYPNCGNLILPLVSIVLGNEMVFYCSGYMIVQTILLWTHCKFIISEDTHFDLKKILLNINMIAIAAGIIMFFLQIKLPTMFQSAVSGMGSLMGPLSMFVVGMLLAGMNMKEVFTNVRAYVVCFLRLVVFPAIILLVFIFTGMTKLFPSASQVLMISLLAASGPAASTVTQFAQLYDNHAFESSVINALSVLLCIITMPIINIIYTFLL